MYAHLRSRILADGFRAPGLGRECVRQPLAQSPGEAEVIFKLAHLTSPSSPHSTPSMQTSHTQPLVEALPPTSPSRPLSLLAGTTKETPQSIPDLPHPTLRALQRRVSPSPPLCLAPRYFGGLVISLSSLCSASDWAAAWPRFLLVRH